MRRVTRVVLNPGAWPFPQVWKCPDCGLVNSGTLRYCDRCGLKDPNREKAA